MTILLQLVGTLVVFSGMVYFVDNRHHSEGLSGALYLSSFGQMLLEENVVLNFIGNTGRFAIFVYVSRGNYHYFEVVCHNV